MWTTQMSAYVRLRLYKVCICTLWQHFYHIHMQWELVLKSIALLLKVAVEITMIHFPYYYYYYYYYVQKSPTITWHTQSDPTFALKILWNSPFQATIICRFENDPSPPPNFQWSIYYNDTELDLDSLPSLHITTFNETDMLNLSGILGLEGDLSLTITCTVGNEYGNDTENTTIRLCSEKACIHYIIIPFVQYIYSIVILPPTIYMT